jgi:hypothetical protein
MFDLRQGLTAFQSNNWTLHFFEIDQGINDQRFQGAVRATNPSNPDMNGRGECEVSPGVGGVFKLTVNWNGGGVSQYNGTFDFEGRLTGITFTPGSPGAPQATWFSKQKFPQFP